MDSPSISQGLFLCTDLDRTLLPNGSQPESPDSRQYFSRFAAHPNVSLAYVSGRHRELVEQAISEYSLPIPDWVVGDVGTTIYKVNAQGWQLLPVWQDDIAADWNGLKSTQLQALFADLTELRLQEEAKQNDYKLSYYLPLRHDIDSLRLEMAQRLSDKALKSSLIYSVDESASIGLLDVLPAGATKLHAVDYLMRTNGFCLKNTIFAGDSGNDLAVLVSPIPSVVVGNAHQDIVSQAFSLARQNGTLASLYHANGGFLAMNGNYSAGILEGVFHYHPEALSWINTG